jgi:hypothetical protein
MEVAGHMVFTTPYANVYALANELATIENPIDNQRCLKVILESTALQMQAARGAYAAPNPSRGPDPRAPTNSRQGNPHRVRAHSRLGP